MARQVTGVDRVKKSLRKFVNEQRRAQRRALSQVGTQGVAMLKARVPVRTGMSKRAMSKRVATSRKTGSTYLVIGPRRKFFATIAGGGATISNKGKVKSIKLRGKGSKVRGEVRPTKYAHLIERKNRGSRGYGMFAAVTRQIEAPARTAVAAEIAKVIPR